MKYKIYHTLPWWLNTAVKCIRQSGRLPSKKYRALPWGLSTTVTCTRVADYHSKNAVHYRGAEYHGSMYQNGRLSSDEYRALPWWLNTAVNFSNLKNRIVTEKSPAKKYHVLKVKSFCTVQLVTSKPSDVGTCVRISVSSHELGFFLTKKNKKTKKQKQQMMENDKIATCNTQNSTSRSSRERNG